MNTKPTGTKSYPILHPCDRPNKEVSYHKMDWLSGLKVMSNEQEQPFSENNLGGDGLFCSPFTAFGDAGGEKNPPTTPPAPIGRFSTF